MNFKIKITSPEHSKAVQEAMFKLGGNWPYESSGNPKYFEKDFLYLQDNLISYGHDLVYFDECPATEVFLQSDETISATEVKVHPFVKMRIEILNTYHSECVQAALFKLGYKWYDCPFGVTYHKDKKWLWVGAGGSITYSHCAEVGDNDKDYALVDLQWLDKMVAEEKREYKEKMEQAIRGSGAYKAVMKTVSGVVPSSSLKDTEVNPKQSVGNLSIPVTSLSPLACALGAIGKLNGSLKYGSSNYIGTEVVMSIYLDAIRRHLDKIVMGETVDEDDGVPHFAAIIANCDIIVSAQAAGTLIDDRVRADGQIEAVKALKPLVASLQEIHKWKNPKDYLMVNKEADSK